MTDPIGGQPGISEEMNEQVTRAILMYRARATGRCEFVQRVDRASINDEGTGFLITLEHENLGWLIAYRWNREDDTLAVVNAAPPNTDVCTGLADIINPDGLDIYLFY